MMRLGMFYLAGYLLSVGFLLMFIPQMTMNLFRRALAGGRIRLEAASKVHRPGLPGDINEAIEAGSF